MMNIIASLSFFLNFLYFFQESTGSSDLFLDEAPTTKFDKFDVTVSDVTLSTTTGSTCPTCPVCPICPICTPPSTPPVTTPNTEATTDEPLTSTTPEQLNDTTTTVEYEVPSTISPSPPIDTTTGEPTISTTPKQPIDTDPPISNEIQSTTLLPIDTITNEPSTTNHEQPIDTTILVIHEVLLTTSPSPPVDTVTDELPTPTTPEQINDTTITVTYEVPSTTSPSPPIGTTPDEPPTPTPKQSIDTTIRVTYEVPSTTFPSPPVETSTKPLIIIPSLSSLDNYHSSLNSNGPDVCEQNSEFQLLILVDSKADDMNLRSVIRTWLKYFRLNKDQTRIVFFVGSPINPMKEINVLRENRDNGDIILTNVPDAPSNYSTMKAVSSLHWVATRCKKAKFVLKIDSHTVVNVQNVLNFIRQNMVSTNTIWGLKHPVPMTHDVYFTGKSYLMTGDTVPKVFCGALKPAIAYNPNENEYITGLVAANEQIKVLDNEKFEFLSLFTTCSKVRDNFIFSMPNSTYSDWINYTYLLEQCEIYLRMDSNVKVVRTH